MLVEHFKDWHSKKMKTKNKMQVIQFNFYFSKAVHEDFISV